MTHQLLSALLRPRLLALAVLLAVAVLPGCRTVQTVPRIPTARPADVGMSAAKLADVDAAVEELIAEGKIAGGVVLIARHGEIVHFEAHGQRDTEPPAPMRTDTIFRIWSMTKPVATAAALILVDDGTLKIDDPVTAYVPELKNLRVQVGDELVAPNRPMSVADLMRHTAGFSYGFLGHPLDATYNTVNPLGADDLAGMAERLHRLPLANHPGEVWQYSLSIDVLGLVIERASGRPLDVFLQERLFDPLDMKDTGFHCPSEKHDRLAAVYTPAKGGGAPQRRTDPDKFSEPTRFFSGGGGLVSTARDYAHFLLMVRGGGTLFGHRILEPETAALMHTNQLPPASFPIGIGRPFLGVGFGFGFSVRVNPDPENPQQPVGRYGWSGAASTHAWVNPADDLVVITLEQRVPYSNDTVDTLEPLIHDAVERR